LTGALAVVIVIGVVIALWVGLGLISRITDDVVEIAGGAIGSAFRASAPQATAEAQGVVALTMPGEEVRSQLASVGTLDPSNDYLTTPSGVIVELSVASGSPRLACRWNPAAVDKPTQIMGDVLRAIRQVDPGAQVLL
jgi:hypothetical protein